MSELDRMATRATNISPERAELLRQIHVSARRSAELLRELTLTSADVRRVGALRVQNDRRWALIEIQASTAGVPMGWIGQAVQQGRHGLDWNERQLLAIPLALRESRSVKRIAHDVRHLTHMAAVATVREHHRARGALADPDPSMAEQLTLNMQALWTRATETSHAITMSDRNHDRIWNIDRYPWPGTIDELVHLDSSEIEVLWWHYADPAIARSAQSSIKELRRDLPGITPPGRDADTAAPLELFLARAHDALHELAEHPSPAPGAIGAAIAEVLPDTDTARAWAPEPDNDPGPTTGNPVHNDRGPGP